MKSDLPEISPASAPKTSDCAAQETADRGAGSGFAAGGGTAARPIGHEAENDAGETAPDDENLSNIVDKLPDAAPDSAGRGKKRRHRSADQADPSDTIDGDALMSGYDIVRSGIDPQTLDKNERKIYDVQMSILEFEIKHQKGIAVSSDEVAVPGRVSVTLCSLIEILAIASGFVTSFIHFAIHSRNYMLAVLVVGSISFMSVILYDTSYRSQRLALSIAQIVGLCLFTALADWAFLDIAINLSPPDKHYALLWLSAAFYSFVPLFMIFHAVYLGRGRRTLKLKPKTTPTTIIERPNAAKTAPPDVH